MKTEELRELALSLAGQYYFGHLETSFSLQWTELVSVIERIAEDDKGIVGDILDHLDHGHASSWLPTCQAFHARVMKVLREVSISLGLDLDERLLSSEDQTVILESEYLFKTYDTSQGTPIVLLEENRDPIGHGTTGLVSWQGAQMLSSWAETFGPSQLEGKRILELGSGLGLFGLSLVGLIDVESFTFTDCHCDVLNFLQINLALNCDRSSLGRLSREDFTGWMKSPPRLFREEGFSLYGGRDRKCKLSVRKLDWTDFSMSDLPKDVDVVLGSDLVYSVDLLPHLAEVIKALLETTTASVCFVACTQRSAGFHDSVFLSEVERAGLRHEVAFKRTFTPQDCIMVNHEPLRPVVLYRITQS